MKDGFFKNFNDVTGTYSELTLTSQKTYSNISIADGFVLGCRDYEVGRKMVFSYDIMYTKWDFPSGADCKEFWIGQRYTNTSDGSEANGKWRSVTSHNLPIVGENGCGKSLLLSNIVDSFYCIAQKGFDNAMEKADTGGEEYYKNISPSQIKVGKKYLYSFISYKDL